MPVSLHIESHTPPPVHTHVKFSFYKNIFVPALALTAYCVFSASNASNWLSFAPISQLMYSTYGINSFQLNLLSMVYMFIFPIGAPIANAVASLSSATLGLVIGAFLNFVGTGFRYASFHVLSLSGGTGSTQAYSLLLSGQILCAISQTFLIGVPPLIAHLYFPPKLTPLITAIATLVNSAGMCLVYCISPLVSQLGLDWYQFIWVLFSALSLVLILSFFISSEFALFVLKIRGKLKHIRVKEATEAELNERDSISISVMSRRQTQNLSPSQRRTQDLTPSPVVGTLVTGLDETQSQDTDQKRESIPVQESPSVSTPPPKSNQEQIAEPSPELLQIEQAIEDEDTDEEETDTSNVEVGEVVLDGFSDDDTTSSSEITDTEETENTDDEPEMEPRQPDDAEQTTDSLAPPQQQIRVTSSTPRQKAEPTLQPASSPDRGSSGRVGRRRYFRRSPSGRNTNLRQSILLSHSMSFRSQNSRGSHRSLPLFGAQLHPDEILSPNTAALFENQPSEVSAHHLKEFPLYKYDFIPTSQRESLASSAPGGAEDSPDSERRTQKRSLCSTIMDQLLETVRPFKNVHFLLLTFCFGVAIGTVWTISTMLDQLLKPLGYTSSDTAIMGVINISCGVVGIFTAGLLASIFSHLRSLLKIFYVLSAASMLAFAACTRSDFRVPLIVCQVLIGFTASGVNPLSQELIAEVLFPINEAIGAKYLSVSGNAIAILLVLTMDRLVASGYVSVSVWILAGLCTMASLISLLFYGKYKRRAYARMRREETRRWRDAQKELAKAENASVSSHGSIVLAEKKSQNEDEEEEVGIPRSNTISAFLEQNGGLSPPTRFSTRFSHDLRSLDESPIQISEEELRYYGLNRAESVSTIRV